MDRLNDDDHPRMSDTDPPDYYSLLGIKPGASSSELRRATQHRLRELRTAYQILRDPRSREAYDQARDQARIRRMKARLTAQAASHRQPAPPSPGLWTRMQRWWQQWYRRHRQRRHRPGRSAIAQRR